MKVVFLTRFSIFDPATTSFVMSRDAPNPEAYKQALFQDERLQRKFEVFQHLTLRCIVKQNHPSWEWHIGYSSFLPRKWVRRLQELVRPYPKIFLHPVKNFQEFSDTNATLLKKMKKPFGTIRLDDDDGFPKDHVKHIVEHYSNRNTRDIVFFTNSVKVVFADNTKTTLSKKPNPAKYPALSYVAINFDIYGAGHHTRIAQQYPLIEDDKPEAAYIFCDDHCDTGRIF